jgi:hypothetical protein
MGADDRRNTCSADSSATDVARAGSVVPDNLGGQGEPLLNLLIAKLVHVARAYCVEISEPFFRLKRYPRPGKIMAIVDGEEPKELPDNCEIAPCVMNWYLYGAREEKSITLKVEFDESDDVKQYGGLTNGLKFPLFQPEKERDKEFSQAWAQVCQKDTEMAAMRPEHGPFKPRADMKDGLRKHYEKMMELVRAVGEDAPDEDAIAKAEGLLWNNTLEKDETGKLFLRLEHPLVQYNLYCAFELIGRYAGWGREFFNSDWRGFWLGGQPHWWEPNHENRRWACLEGNASLENYMDRSDENDLLVRLFDSVVEDRMLYSFTGLMHLNGKEVLLCAAMPEETKTKLALVSGHSFAVKEDIASRRHIPLTRLAEKIMDVFQRESDKASDGKPEKINIAIVGDTSAKDIRELWELITSENTWGLDNQDKKNKLSERFAITVYTKSKIDKQNENIKIEPVDSESVLDVPYTEFRLVFLLDCDGLYENTALPKAQEFYYFLEHSYDDFDDKGHSDEDYAEGMYPENTMFSRAWMFLDSFAGGGGAYYYKRTLCIDALESILYKLNGSLSEVYVYASDVPGDNAYEFYRDDRLRLCRRETLGSNVITLLRLTNTLQSEAETIKTEAGRKPELRISLWQLFKSFDSHVCEWLGNMQLPPHGSICNCTRSMTVQSVLSVLFGNERKKIEIHEWAYMLKSIYIILDYKELAQKKVQYYFEFCKDILKRADNDRRGFLRLECFLKKMIADFFLWIQNEGLPNPELPFVKALRTYCLRVFSNCVLGSCKSVKDMLLFFAIDEGGCFTRDIQFLLDEKREKARKDEIEKNDDCGPQIPPNVIDRWDYVQFMRIINGRFTPGRETLLNTMAVDVPKAAKAVHRACEELGYDLPMYGVSGQL